MPTLGLGRLVRSDKGSLKKHFQAERASTRGNNVSQVLLAGVAVNGGAHSSSHTPPSILPATYREPEAFGVCGASIADAGGTSPVE